MDRGGRQSGATALSGVKTKSRLAKAGWGMVSVRLAHRPPDQRMMSMSMLRAPQRR